MTYADLFKSWAAVLAAILAALLLSTALSPTGADAQELSAAKDKVVLDPGHGGTDSGAVEQPRRTQKRWNRRWTSRARHKDPPRARRLLGVHDAHHRLANPFQQRPLHLRQRDKGTRYSSRST